MVNPFYTKEVKYYFIKGFLKEKLQILILLEVEQSCFSVLLELFKLSLKKILPT